MNTNEQIAYDLERAAKLIEERGWTQEEYEDAAGRMCAAEALHQAVQNRDSGPHFIILESALQRNLVDWNDAPGRTKAEVVGALLDCAAECRKGGV